MILKQSLPAAGLASLLALTVVTAPSAARANVYATNIKLNGSSSTVAAKAGDSVLISYILNESASGGVVLEIYTGAGVVRQLQIAGNSVGSLRGSNTVTWDGKDNRGNNLPTGTYSVRITAASSGYSRWTATTDDNNPGNLLNWGTGIAVDRNPNSPYYGRVFVANALEGPNPGSNPGDQVGILKLNADGSAADEGIYSSGGDNVWAGGGVSPWKIEVSADDYVYVSDLASGVNGQVYRFDPTIAPASRTNVLRADNIPSGAHLSGPFITGTGTNTQVWMADQRPSSLGVRKWRVTADGTCATNDLGSSVVGLGGALLSAPYDVALDGAGRIYTCQNINASGDTSARVLGYPAYDPATNSGMPEIMATWAVGGGDDNYAEASGLAVDPTGTYVAVAFSGLDAAAKGNTAVFYATNGLLAGNLDLGLAFGGYSDSQHADVDCAWDAVGNVYCVDEWYGVWRAFSPPGTNQATTVATATLQISGAVVPPLITQSSIAQGALLIDFTGSASDSAQNFKLVSASAVNGTYAPVASVTLSNVAAGRFRAAVAVPGGNQFYRIQR